MPATCAFCNGPAEHCDPYVGCGWPNADDAAEAAIMSDAPAADLRAMAATASPEWAAALRANADERESRDARRIICCTLRAFLYIKDETTAEFSEAPALNGPLHGPEALHSNRRLP